MTFEILFFVKASRVTKYDKSPVLQTDRREITARTIKNILQGKEDPEKPKTLVEIFIEHNKQVHSLVGIDYAEMTARKFDTSLLRLKEYLATSTIRKTLLLLT